jgi:hypothetical protein
MKCRSVSSSAILMVIDLPLETSTVAFTLCSVIGDSNIPIAIIDDVNKGVSSTIFKKQSSLQLIKPSRNQGSTSQATTRDR